MYESNFLYSNSCEDKKYYQILPLCKNRLLSLSFKNLNAKINFLKLQNYVPKFHIPNFFHLIFIYSRKFFIVDIQLVTF